MLSGDSSCLYTCDKHMFSSISLDHCYEVFADLESLLCLIMIIMSPDTSTGYLVVLMF